MNNFYTKKKGFTSYTPNEIVNLQRTAQAKVNGKWQIPRPVPYQSFIMRLQQAFDVLTYKADALYWLEETHLTSKE
jgi:hypothetical protein